MKKRLRVLYSGTVQGVGFRAAVARLARNLPVAGSIRNRRDGRVELLVEGEESAIVHLLDRIGASHLASGIETVEATWEEPAGNLCGFVIAWGEKTL